MDYSTDSKQFNDPILRCMDCNKLVHRLYISKHGGCNHCGNRRLKNVLAIKEDEMAGIGSGEIDFGIEQSEWHPIDADFLTLFEGVQ